jgi:hypothetical protein
LETIKINFGFFWPSFSTQDNFITRVLVRKYQVEISDNPDFYFFTHPYNGKRDYLNYNCHRVFIGWENQRADWLICDYVLDSDFLMGNPRHKRYPLWATWHPQQLLSPKNPNLFTGKDKFCCMLVSNAKAKERIRFFNELSNYKKVDSAGSYMNNIGRSILDKMDFIKDYKFVISFENSSTPGYTTEKLIEPMLVGSIPIYWGNAEVAKDFNTRSFVNINDFDSYREAIEFIIELDNNDEKYRAMAAAPWFNDNHVPEDLRDESLLQFFEFMIEDSKSKKPVARFFVNVYLHKLWLMKQRVEGAIYARLGIQIGFR